MYTETLDWINFFRDVDRRTLENKIIEVEQEVDPLIEIAILSVAFDAGLM